MLIVIALLLIIFGTIAAFRGRALLHWKRGYRNLSSYQRRWMVRRRDATTIRIYGAALIGAGLLTMLAGVQSLAEPARGFLAMLDAEQGLGQHRGP